MKEIWDLAISPPMLPLTILLVPVAVYWILSIIGAVDDSFASVDDGGLDGHGGPLDLLHGALRIVNAREVPVMIVLSALVIWLWGCSMVGNALFNPGESGWPALAVVLASLGLSLFLTRFSLIPFKPLFRLMQADVETAFPVAGRTGVVRTAFVTSAEGQVEVENRGAPLLLNARVLHGEEPLPRGTTVLVVSQDAGSGICTVRPLSENLPVIQNP